MNVIYEYGDNISTKLIRENILFADFLVDILKYLSIQDLYITRSTSRLFLNLIDEEKSSIFDKINFCYTEQQFSRNFFSQWLLKIISQNRVKSLNLLLCHNHNFSNDIINCVNRESLTKLKIHVKIFKTGNEITHLTNIKNLSAKNMFYDQSDFEDNIKAITNIVKMPWIEELKLNNIKFINCFFLELTKNKFSKIDFKESAEFKIQDMTLGLNKIVKDLKILRIDGEFSEEIILIKTLAKLQNLSELYIGYCQNFSDEFIIQLSKINFSFAKLSLRKLKVSSTAIENFFEKGDFSETVKLDFYDCPSLNNTCVNHIAMKALKLEYLEISWSLGVKDDSVLNLLKNCFELRYLYLQGCKYLTDFIFTQILLLSEGINERPCSKLKLIDLSKCDLIQDRILYKMIEKFVCLNVINYYGVDLRDEIND